MKPPKRHHPPPALATDEILRGPHSGGCCCFSNTPQGARAGAAHNMCHNRQHRAAASTRIRSSTCSALCTVRHACAESSCPAPLHKHLGCLPAARECDGQALTYGGGVSNWSTPASSQAPAASLWTRQCTQACTVTLPMRTGWLLVSTRGVRATHTANNKPRPRCYVHHAQFTTHACVPQAKSCVSTTRHRHLPNRNVQSETKAIRDQGQMATTSGSEGPVPAATPPRMTLRNLAAANCVRRCHHDLNSVHTFVGTTCQRTPSSAAQSVKTVGKVKRSEGAPQQQQLGQPAATDGPHAQATNPARELNPSTCVAAL